jgi:apolipoprotein N-acyltransferase
MGRYIKSGANLICIITNDGWWKNTPGYKQHMNYARLRAIETRKNIARSANTGISCFIDENGNVYEPQPWNTTAAIKMNLPLNTYKTFYVRFGDWLYKLMTALSVLLFLIRIFLKLRKKLKDRSAEVQK